MNVKEYTYRVSAAGRVNIIGEHIDYCGGKVLPAALSLKNTVYIRPNGTNTINISWTTLPNRVSLDIDKLDSYKNLKYGNYQAGAALMWQRAHHSVIGCDMLQDCTVPFGSGLSSSAAIEVSTIAALATVAGDNFDPVDVALKSRQAECEYAGVNCGIMDQYASACGKKGCAMLLDCDALECEYIPIDLGEYSFVIIDSKKPHNLIESKYNERRAETEQALKILKNHINIRNLAGLTPEMFSEVSHFLPDVLYKRTKHVVDECERVRMAKQAILSDDCVALGKLIDSSHASLSQLYEVTGRELDSLAEIAQKHPACVGSRMTGGGFGGSTISIVKSTEIADFKSYVLKNYEKATGLKAVCYDAEISDGITVEKI